MGGKKTYNRRDSQMVTHSSTSRPVQCLCMAERTGCPVFTDLWSYVLISQTNMHMVLMQYMLKNQHGCRVSVGVYKDRNQNIIIYIPQPVMYHGVTNHLWIYSSDLVNILVALGSMHWKINALVFVQPFQRNRHSLISIQPCCTQSTFYYCYPRCCRIC